MRRNYIPRRPQKRKKRPPFFLIILGAIFVYIIFLRPENPEDNVLSVKSPGEKVNGEFVNVVKPAGSLKEAVENPLEGSRGTYSIVVKNLKTGESYLKSEDREYEAGSLYKLWVMGEAFRQINEGILNEGEVLSQEVGVLNDKFNIATESAEQKEGRVTLSVKEALEGMITISHNYAALLLSEKIKLSNVAEYIEDNGFKDSTVGTDGSSPKTTASEIASFFEKLYKGELANSGSSKKMIDLLLSQQLNNKLPKNLPSDINVAHKTGELGWVSHDAGIIFSSKGDYIIVVLSESNDPKGANERIAKVSESVFNYFNK